MRVHERSRARHHAGAAVREGIARTGGMITAAGRRDDRRVRAFTIDGARVRERFGLVIETSVFLDAIVIRCCC
jgi:RND superfamily putative drug exporter